MKKMADVESRCEEAPYSGLLTGRWVRSGAVGSGVGYGVSRRLPGKKKPGAEAGLLVAEAKPLPPTVPVVAVAVVRVRVPRAVRVRVAVVVVSRNEVARDVEPNEPR